MMLGERKPFGGAVFIILVGVVVIQEIRVNWYKNRLSDNLEEPFIQSVLQTDHETTSVETTTLEATTFNTEETHTEGNEMRFYDKPDGNSDSYMVQIFLFLFAVQMYLAFNERDRSRVTER